VLLALACVTLNGVAAPQPAAHSTPTAGDVRELFEKGDYAQALRQATVALSAKGAAAALDRYELLVLKGESQLRLKNNKDAAEAFDDAAGCAKDEHEAALARSMAELARRAKGLVYTIPATKDRPAKTIDISVRDQRPAAFAALFEQNKPKVAAEVKAARGSGKLPAMFDAFRLLFDLRALELAGTGTDTQTAVIAGDLTERAAALMGRSVGDMGKTVDKLTELAWRVIERGAAVPGAGLVPTHTGRQGLDRDQVALLRRIISDCERMGAVAMDLKKLFPGEQADALRNIRDDADGVASRARQLADTRWTLEDEAGAGADWGQPAAVGPQSAMDKPRGGTNRIQKTNDPGNRSAGPRGVSTAGPR